MEDAHDDRSRHTEATDRRRRGRHGLAQGAPARHAIETLQTLLQWLGFDRELKWAKFGADGANVGATTASFVAFGRCNGRTVSVERVSSALAQKILARYDTLDELRQLAEDVDKKRIESHYRKGGADRIRIACPSR